MKNQTIPNTFRPIIHPVDDSTLIFLHITKTAGTTLKRILERHYYQRTIVTVQKNLKHPDLNDILFEDFVNLSFDQKKNIRFMRGHFEFGIHQYLHIPYIYITMLRDPIERAISWYYFVLQNPDSEDYKKLVVKSNGFEDFIAKGYAGRNSITKVLLSKEQRKKAANDYECLAIAKENLEKYFSFVGFVEDFDKSLILLKHILGWQDYPIYIRENVTRSRPKKSDLPQSTIDVIKEVNWADIELYDYAKKWFNNVVEQFEEDFDVELEKLSLLNQLYVSGMIVTARKEYDLAVEFYRNALKLDSNSSIIEKELGQVYYLQGDMVSALKSFVRVMELNPYDREAIAFSIALLQHLGKQDDANRLKTLL